MSFYEDRIKDDVMERAKGCCECNYPFHTHAKNHGKFGDEFYFHWSHGRPHIRRPLSNMVIVVCPQCHAAIESFQGQIH